MCIIQVYIFPFSKSNQEFIKESSLIVEYNFIVFKHKVKGYKWLIRILGLGSNFY